MLLIVETTDLLFAVDSIPAIFGITKDPFIIFTSNVFAILGLRALYFLLAGMIDTFHYLHYGLAAVLGFVGLKMVAEGWLPHEPGKELHAGLGVAGGDCGPARSSDNSVYCGSETPGRRQPMNSTALQLRRAATNRYLFAASLLALFHPSGNSRSNSRVLHIEPGVTATIVAPPAMAIRRRTADAAGALCPAQRQHHGADHRPLPPRVSIGITTSSISAQTRVLRQAITDRNIVVAYLENDVHSWPAWRQKHPKESLAAIVPRMKETLPTHSAAAPKPPFCLTGHSGGGSFIFGIFERGGRYPKRRRAHRVSGQQLFF